MLDDERPARALVRRYLASAHITEDEVVYGAAGQGLNRGCSGFGKRQVKRSGGFGGGGVCQEWLSGWWLGVAVVGISVCV